MNMKMKKILAGALMVAATCSMTVPVFATSVNTSEFGTFNYDLTKSGNKVTAKTSCTKTADILMTKLEIQINSTGESLGSWTVTKDNAKENAIVKATNVGNVKLAAFSAHCAIGKTSVAKYKAEVF